MPRVSYAVLAIVFAATGFISLASEQTNQNSSDTVYNTSETPGLYEKLANGKESSSEAVYKKSYIVTTSQNVEADQTLQNRQYIRFLDAPWF